MTYTLRASIVAALLGMAILGLAGCSHNPDAGDVPTNMKQVMGSPAPPDAVAAMNAAHEKQVAKLEAEGAPLPGSNNKAQAPPPPTAAGQPGTPATGNSQ